MRGRVVSVIQVFWSVAPIHVPLPPLKKSYKQLLSQRNRNSYFCRIRICDRKLKDFFFDRHTWFVRFTARIFDNPKLLHLKKLTRTQTILSLNSCNTSSSKFPLRYTCRILVWQNEWQMGRKPNNTSFFHHSRRELINQDIFIIFIYFKRLLGYRYSTVPLIWV